MTYSWGQCLFCHKPVSWGNVRTTGEYADAGRLIHKKCVKSMRTVVLLGTPEKPKVPHKPHKCPSKLVFDAVMGRYVSR